MDNIFNTLLKCGIDFQPLRPTTNSDDRSFYEVQTENADTLTSFPENEGYVVYNKHTPSGAYEVTKIEKGARAKARVPYFIVFTSY